MKNQEMKNNAFDRVKAGRRETCINRKYFGSTHDPWGWPVYCKSCSRHKHFNFHHVTSVITAKLKIKAPKSKYMQIQNRHRQ